MTGGDGFVRLARKPGLLLKALRDPCYFYNPRQLFRRISMSFCHPPENGRVCLPWGVCIGYDRRDHIGHTILTEGLYELLVCEILWRLTSPGDTCVDAGANIGQMTGLMAVKAGRDGCVLAFEPHPVLFAELSSNAVEWRKEPDVASIQASQCALSSENTQGRITVSADFATNRGIARLVGAGDEMGSDATACFDVAVHRLDALLPSATQIGVLKVDVEGHELEVFHGSGALLAGHAV